MKPHSPTIQKLSGATVTRPTRTTFATARGAKNHIRSVLVTVTCSDGSVGAGEVPTSFVLPHETTDAIKKVLAAFKPKLIGQPVANWSVLTAACRKQFPDFHMTASGMEVALFRAYLAAEGQSEIAWWGRHHKPIETDITVPFAADIALLTSWLQRAVRNGFTTYKIKVSGSVKTDTTFVRSVWEYLTNAGIRPTLRLDGNQGFTADSAMRLLDGLDALSIPIELFEQPLQPRDDNGAARLYKQIPIPLIADETVFCAADCRRVIDNGLAHGVNIKIAKSGISESRTILKLAQQANLKRMIGCMTETLTGLSAGIYAAAGSGAFDYIDLDSIHFLYPSQNKRPITIDGPRYRIGGTA